ncbi:DNA mismatch repair endonuclease MutL [Vibrio sinensis]|uniref:DNA mismatch repair protein MutL n=1 Tax=Vibrio sinensis TaxID=2302434 RepID=A0A3A6QG84_9VIBR|nr:DNA mismatch repair endonuclease MutL [Vibrio sinensis]RJX65024.1 DNA mismatch repair endonuclease MutL [Vibrio sinensis]
MTIKILPARLANQIAAGEVVERPASVVKELVENSLDSGATRIDIDIEKGGAKLIRVRDNGKGIDKEELGLALSRHATSKIHTLDDLEAIMSLGFRGEALASISSVSRLTLTSRPATQEQAWAAHSEGRDMQVKLQPSAHPIGTSVEVVDLFFNTPARRKFLRTEKTEFAHIDELIKRIALSRFDVTINLRHNGKLIKQYRASKTDAQAEKRIATVCGNNFVRHMLKIELEHQGLKLHGWITTPDGARQQSDLQYCYVNGRMMRDKLINHAIRQSYETSLRAEQFATYVLFIEIDPHQVDVNVHPAKHEVRFHQARLVHDFIYQALSDALVQSASIDKPSTSKSAFHHAQSSQSEDQSSSRGGNVPERVYQAIENTPSYPGKQTSEYSSDQIGERVVKNEWNNSGRQTPSERAENIDREENIGREANVNHERISHQRQNSSVPYQAKSSPSHQELTAYKALLTTPEVPKDDIEFAVRQSQQSVRAHSQQPSSQQLSHQQTSQQFDQDIPQQQVQLSDELKVLGKAICIVDGRYVLLGDKQGAHLLSLARAEWLRVYGQLTVTNESLKSQPLLVPLSLKLDEDQIQISQTYQAMLNQLGIETKLRPNKALMVMGVPQPLRQQNLQQLIPDLLSYAVCHLQSNPNLSTKELSKWLANQITQVKSDYTLSEAIQIIAELELLWQGQLPLQDRTFVRSIDFSATIAALTL